MNQPQPLIPATLAQDTLESLHAVHGTGRPVVYWLILLLCCSGLGALPLVKIDVAVSAPGVVRPATERSELRAPVSALIARVLAADNDRVQAGQPLIVLQSQDLDQRLARNVTLQREKTDLIHDLVALGEAARADAAGSSAAGPADSLLRTQAMQHELTQHRAQLEGLRRNEDKLRRNHTRYSLLAARGIVAACDLDDARFALDQAAGETAVFIRQNASRWQTRLCEEQTSLDALESETMRLREEREVYTVRAPDNGILVGFTGWRTGIFVPSGQVLGAVSPDDSLVAEVLVPPRDAGLVKAGQPVKIQVDAFPYTRWGMLEGTVASVSGDYVVGASQQPAFKVTVHPAARELHLPNGIRGELKKGLTLQARFLVARRSLLQMLYDDASLWLDPRAPLRES